MDETIRQKRSKHLKLKQHQEKMPENILRSIKTSSNYVKKNSKETNKIPQNLFKKHQIPRKSVFRNAMKPMKIRHFFLTPASWLPPFAWVWSIPAAQDTALGPEHQELLLHGHRPSGSVENSMIMIPGIYYRDFPLIMSREKL